MSKSKKNRHSYISVPSQIITPLSSSSLQNLLLSPKKPSKNPNRIFRNPNSLFIFLLFLFAFVGMAGLGFRLHPLLPFSAIPCEISEQHSSFSAAVSAVPVAGSVGEEEMEEFWKQPDGLGFRPCLDFSQEYRRWSEAVSREKTRYLMVVVSGGLNQQRNQIVDAVVIARILGASLVVPILQVNVIWGDESEFSDIFDLEHFKRTLANDVRIVSSLPSTHLRSRPVEEKRTPLHVSPEWIRSRYLKRLNKEGVLLLRGLDSRLSKDLPSDLQKLRCKVAFNALRFSAPIMEIGNKFAERMRRKGPFIALHLRLEKDVWVRTGCLPGLSHKYDEIISNERKLRPELLTGRSNMSFHDRKLAGLCPLNAVEITRLLKALGAPRNARIYWAGGRPFGGLEALLPLTREFPYFYNKEDLSLPGELEPFAKKASLLAAIDYIVSENSDVFMPSHGGNMGRAIKGHRAYAGHKKYITPNKRQMLHYFLNSTLSEREFKRIVKELHQDSLGQPDIRTSKAGRDVIAYPVPECMCKNVKKEMRHVL
ncbi:O-fucosyltransferase family protein [Cinnamomum micranthum f. kanehirae]|uniref:O-fucosyltransferase family protein n=1 Tax=Cinnamomum micranthum f. kanehirae TaxID=337451 RepID=A0A3S3MS55_9MAGN|nr:O-fucosyltransferase family protein [Cinnamomum micranthum f. kanehirae]